MSSFRVTEATPLLREELLRLEEKLFGRESAVRATWLLDGNPEGKALVLVAQTPAGRVAGTRSLLPWPLLVEGERMQVGQYTRTWTHPDFRHQGVSVLLGEALNRQSAELGYPLVFLFPSVRSIPGHRRIGNVLDTMLERRQVLLSARIAYHWAPAFLDVPLSWARRATRWVGRKAAGRWQREPNPARKADRLWGRLSPPTGVTGVRDGTFVGWRYSSRSGRLYETWSYPAGEDARLLAATHMWGRRARILDLWGELDPPDTASALAGLIELLIGGGAWLVEWCPPRFGPGPKVAGRAGLWPRRKGVPLARWFNRSPAEIGSLADLNRYRLTEGDADYA